MSLAPEIESAIIITAGNFAIHAQKFIYENSKSKTPIKTMPYLIDTFKAEYNSLHKLIESMSTGK
jgi:hypothetical protein